MYIYRLFLLENMEPKGKRFYDSCVVIAIDKESAILIKPTEIESEWSDNIKVTVLGISNKNTPGIVVCSSFNERR